MKLFFRHIGLLLGIASTILSFLFFGRQQDIYQLLLIGGLISAVIFYLMILLSKEHWKSKIAWSAVVIIGAVCQQLTESKLIDTSYRIYIKQHEKVLADVNSILDYTSGDVTILHDTIIYQHGQFTKAIKYNLVESRKKLGVYLISKTDHEIYYCLSSFLDVRLGFIYWAEKDYPDIHYRHLVGNWFR